VSSSVTTIDVVRAKHGPREFGGEKIHLVARFGAGEDPERFRTVLYPIPEEALRRAIERLFPGGFAERAILPNEWRCEARIADLLLLSPFHESENRQGVQWGQPWLQMPTPKENYFTGQ
jgi:hypothetical protein